MIGQNEIGNEHFLILGLDGDEFLYSKSSNSPKFIFISKRTDKHTPNASEVFGYNDVGDNVMSVNLRW